MCSEGKNSKDAFAEMMAATATVDLRLSDYHPHSQLKVAEHPILFPQFPVIDFHNHLDAESPDQVLRIMDTCGIEKIVNITMQTGPEGIAQLLRYQQAAPQRFSFIGWMDWNGIERGDFIQISMSRMEELARRGACGIKFWKDLGLKVRDGEGKLLRVDDERLAPLFDKAAELGMFVMFHTADPDAFFQPVDCNNERFEELAAHADWSFSASPVSKDSLLSQRDAVIARHPRTKFVCAHLAESGEHLERVSELLDRCPNAYVDISARVSELGRQPYTARRFMMRYADRILFGADLPPSTEMYRLYYRFLETDDEYFEYPSHASRQGRWNIYGLYLPANVLERIYRSNALELLMPR